MYHSIWSHKIISEKKKWKIVLSQLHRHSFQILMSSKNISKTSGTASGSQITGTTIKNWKKPCKYLGIETMYNADVMGCKK